MSYSGLAVPIPMGQGGLHTDDSPSAIPPTDLILANNIAVFNNEVQNFPGSILLNLTAVPKGVWGAFDFWYDTLVEHQRLILLGGDGNTYAMDNAGNITLIPASGGGPALLNQSNPTNQTFFMTGGPEGGSGDEASKKLFIFTGEDPVQVVVGAATTRKTIDSPPTDWSGANQPSFGIMYQNAIMAAGNLNYPHNFYVSSATDLQDFKWVGESTPGAGDGTSRVIPCYPGEQEKLIGAMVYNGTFFAFKYPFGVYQLIQPTASDSSTWYFQKYGGGYGFASPHCLIPVLNDVFIKNSSGGITSVFSSQDFGNTTAGDILSQLRIEQYIRDNTNQLATPNSHAVYYADRKLAMFTYQSPQGTQNDTILCFRVDIAASLNSTIRAAINPKAMLLNFANPNVMALRKDVYLVNRPIWGDQAGNIYQMDTADSTIVGVNGQSFNSSFQTPHMDFGFKDPTLATKNKSFDFVELRYVPQGTGFLLGDVYIDGKFTETLQFPLTGDALLAYPQPMPNDFWLSDSETDPNGSFLSDNYSLLSVRKRLHGTGRTISIKFYNGSGGQTFIIATAIFSFRPSGEQTH